jgi:hypothetical protein
MFDIFLLKLLSCDFATFFFMLVWSGGSYQDGGEGHADICADEGWCPS